MNTLDEVLQQVQSLIDKEKYLLAIDLLEQSYKEHSYLLDKLVECYANYARILSGYGDYDRAIELYLKAIQHRPDVAELYFNLANTYKKINRLSDAIEFYLKVIRLCPHQVSAMFNLANTFRRLSRNDDAEFYYTKALEYDPNMIDVLFHLGLLYIDKGNFHSASDMFDKVIARSPDYLNVAEKKAICYFHLYQYGDCISWIRAAQASGKSTLLMNIMLSMAYFAQGRLDQTLHFNLQLLTDKGQLNQRTVSFILRSMLYAEGLSPQKVYDQHFALGHEFWPSVLEGVEKKMKTERTRLRIGWISPDFREHSVSYFLQPIFTHYSRARFENYLYSNNVRNDETTTWFRQHADCWREIRLMDDVQVAAQVKSDHIDILVDLTGHFDENRLGVFTFRPAPVQLSYLGYPATTGINCIHYRLSDPYSDPPGASEHLYTETLFRLSRTLWCYQPVFCKPCRVSISLDRPIRLGSFNHISKVNPSLIALWAKILLALPSTCLILKDKSFNDRETLRYFQYLFRRQGVPLDQIDLRPSLPDHQLHMEQYQEIDIALDPFPYNGTTTTFEALWMGVPVITLAGQSHVSRVGVSILTNLGRPEWIANTQEDYVAKVLALASDRPALMGIKQTLRQQLQSSCLMDGVSFVRDFESALEQIWQLYQAKCQGTL